MSGFVVQVYNSSIWEVEAGGFEFEVWLSDIILASLSYIMRHSLTKSPTKKMCSVPNFK
jgi:hypothetical protein